MSGITQPSTLASRISILNPPAMIAPTTSNILTALSPALTHSLSLATIFHRFLSTTAFFVLFRAYFLSMLLLRQTYHTSHVLLIQGCYGFALLSKQVYLIVKQTLGRAWKALERFRNKLFFEFMVFVLGGGYGLLLVIFWPGWVVVIGALALWFVYG